MYYGKLRVNYNLKYECKKIDLLYCYKFCNIN